MLTGLNQGADDDEDNPYNDEGEKRLCMGKCLELLFLFLYVEEAIHVSKCSFLLLL